MDRDHDFDDAIDTLATTVGLSDGILHIRSKGIVSTDESVQQTVAASLRLTDGRRHPVLFDARIWPGGDPRGWMTVINEMRTAFSAGAMVVEPAALAGLNGRMDVSVPTWTKPGLSWNRTSASNESTDHRHSIYDG